MQASRLRAYVRTVLLQELCTVLAQTFYFPGNQRLTVLTHMPRIVHVLYVLEKLFSPNEKNDRENEHAPSVGAGPAKKRCSALGQAGMRQPGARAEAEAASGRGSQQPEAARACAHPRPPRGALRPVARLERLPPPPPPRPRRFGQGSHAALPYVNPTSITLAAAPAGPRRRRPRSQKKKYASRAVFSVAGSHIDSDPRRRLFARMFSQTLPSYITFSHVRSDRADSTADRPRPLAPRGRRGPPNPRHHAAFETRRAPTI